MSDPSDEKFDRPVPPINTHFTRLQLPTNTPSHNISNSLGFLSLQSPTTTRSSISTSSSAQSVFNTYFDTSLPGSLSTTPHYAPHISYQRNDGSSSAHIDALNRRSIKNFESAVGGILSNRADSEYASLTREKSNLIEYEKKKNSPKSMLDSSNSFSSSESRSLLPSTSHSSVNPSSSPLHQQSEASLQTVDYRPFTSPEITIVSSRKATKRTKKCAVENADELSKMSPKTGSKRLRGKDNSQSGRDVISRVSNITEAQDFDADVDRLNRGGFAFTSETPASQIASATNAFYQEALRVKALSQIGLPWAGNPDYDRVDFVNPSSFMPASNPYSNQSLYQMPFSPVDRYNPFLPNHDRQEFIKGFKAQKPWLPPSPTKHDPVRSFETRGSILVAGKISHSQRNTDEKTTNKHAFNKILVEFSYKEIRPGAPGWNETGQHNTEREIIAASRNLAAMLVHVKNSAINGDEIIARTIVQLMSPEVENVHKHILSPDSNRSDEYTEAAPEPTAMEIFYDVLQKKCPMLLYILSNFLMTKSFLHKNIPAFIRNKCFYKLCSSKTIGEVEAEISDMKKSGGKGKSAQQNNSSEVFKTSISSIGETNQQDESNEQMGNFKDSSSETEDEPNFPPNDFMNNGSDEAEPFMRSSISLTSRSQKPRSLWERWPQELLSLFTKVTSLIGIMFNMKANGGARAAASNLSLLLRVADLEHEGRRDL